MSRIIYVNGEFVPENEAKVSIFDRGFLFGDGVYEVIPVLRAHLVQVDYALQRLRNSLAAVGIAWPCSTRELLAILKELRHRNSMDEGVVYLQITRGVAERDFAFPAEAAPGLVAFTTARQVIDNPAAARGLSIISVDDLRWRRRDIKSINLLAQCLARQQAVSAGADEAWMVQAGQVTEGSSSSAYIIKDGCVITRDLSEDILPGVRRRAIVELAARHAIPVLERPFSIEEACQADEAFLSSAGTLVMPVISIDGHRIGSGAPGPLTRRLRQLYIELLLAEAQANEGDKSAAKS